MQNNESLPPYTVESVHNALTILLMFRRTKHVRLVDASNHLNVSRSTAHRMMQTLALDGFVEQDPETKSYRLGPALRELGLAAVPMPEVMRICRPQMERLVAQLRETVNLIVPEGDNVRFLDGVESTQSVRVSTRPGLLRPAHVTSAGKLFLAHRSQTEFSHYVEQGLHRYNDATLADGASLAAEIERVGELGYALNIGESDENIHAIAVPIRGGGNRAVAALAVSVPVSRGSEAKLLSFLPQLHDAVREIEREL